MSSNLNPKPRSERIIWKWNPPPYFLHIAFYQILAGLQCTRALICTNHICALTCILGVQLCHFACIYAHCTFYACAWFCILICAVCHKRRVLFCKWRISVFICTPRQIIMLAIEKGTQNYNASTSDNGKRDTKLFKYFLN